MPSYDYCQNCETTREFYINIRKQYVCVDCKKPLVSSEESKPSKIRKPKVDLWDKIANYGVKR